MKIRVLKTISPYCWYKADVNNFIEVSKIDNSGNAIVYWEDTNVVNKIVHKGDFSLVQKAGLTQKAIGWLANEMQLFISVSDCFEVWEELDKTYSVLLPNFAILAKVSQSDLIINLPAEPKNIIFAGPYTNTNIKINKNWFQQNCIETDKSVRIKITNAPENSYFSFRQLVNGIYYAEINDNLEAVISFANKNAPNSTITIQSKYYEVLEDWYNEAFLLYNANLFYKKMADFAKPGTKDVSVTAFYNKDGFVRLATEYEKTVIEQTLAKSKTPNLTTFQREILPGWIHNKPNKPHYRYRGAYRHQKEYKQNDVVLFRGKYYILLVPSSKGFDPYAKINFDNGMIQCANPWELNTL